MFWTFPSPQAYVNKYHTGKNKPKSEREKTRFQSGRPKHREASSLWKSNIELQFSDKSMDFNGQGNFPRIKIYNSIVLRNTSFDLVFLVTSDDFFLIKRWAFEL